MNKLLSLCPQALVVLQDIKYCIAKKISSIFEEDHHFEGVLKNETIFIKIDFFFLHQWNFFYSYINGKLIYSLL